MRASVNLATAALLAFAGCAVVVEPSESEGVTNGAAAAEHTDAPGWAAKAPELFTVGGQLRTAHQRSAREAVCVAYDADQKVVSIDEFECTTERDPLAAEGSVQVCASCVMEMRAAQDGSGFMVARHDRQCQLFAGSYLLGREHTAMACGDQPNETLVVQPKCEHGAAAPAKCVSEPPPIPMQAKYQPRPY